MPTQNDTKRPGKWVLALPRPLRWIFSFFLGDVYSEDENTRRAIVLLNLFFLVLSGYTVLYMVALLLAYLGLLDRAFIEQFLYYMYLFLCFMYAGGKEGARRIKRFQYKRRGEYFVVFWWVYLGVFVAVTIVAEVFGLGDSQRQQGVLGDISWVTFWVSVALISSTALKRGRQLLGKFKGGGLGGT